MVAKLDGKCGRLRQSVVFKTAAKALNEAGLGTTKTYQHCKGKYRKLKEKFQELEKHNDRKRGSDRKTCENYDLLATLFSKRMTASGWGYDSGSQDVPGAAGTNQEGPLLGAPGTSDTDGDTTPKLTSKKLPPKYKSGNFTMNMPSM